MEGPLNDIYDFMNKLMEQTVGVSDLSREQ